MSSVVITQNSVSFVKTTSVQFATLTPRSSDAIYFLTDTRDIYVGDSCYTDKNVVFADASPEYETAAENILYVVKIADGTYKMYVKGESDIVSVGGHSNVSIDDITDILQKSESGDNTKIPTVGAVEEAITTALADYSGAIVDVSADRSGNNTVITFTPKKGEPKTVTIADLFLSAASYDTETHVLSLTVTGQDDPVEVNLAALIPQAISTSDVAMAQNITCTVDVGNYKKGDVIDISDTTTLQKFLVGMLSQDSNPTTSQPKAYITLTGAGAKEVGTSFNVQYSASLNPGSYSDTAEGKQNTEVTATSWTITDTEGHSATTQTGNFDNYSYIIADNTNYYVSVSVAHTQGVVPKTFLGSEYPEGQIKSGTKTANSSSITGYRMGFYGSLTDKSSDITSALVRGLSGKSNKKIAKGQKYTVSVPSDTQRVIVAYDASIGDVASITSAEEFGSEIKDSFVKHTISVEGANSFAGINYNVYVKDLAAPQVNATTYTVTI